jgi:hypothetical protein
MSDEQSIEDLARDWLGAERAHTAGRVSTGDRAESISAAYEAAVRAATKEELLIAWHAAIRRQDETEMGSSDWANAREVSELLRVEYLASQ